MGEFFAITSGIFYALNTMFAQRGMRNASSSTAMMIDMSANLIIFLAYLLITGNIFLSGLPRAGIFWSLIAGIFGAWLGRTLILEAVKRIGSPRSISLSLTQILFSFLLGRIILGEIINLASLSGVFLVVLGVFWLTRERANLAPEIAAALNLSPTAQKKFQLIGVFLAILAGLSFSGSDLFRKMGVGLINSPVMIAALGGVAAVIAQAMVVTYKGSWHEIIEIDHYCLKNLLISGVAGGLALIFVANALRHCPVVIVGALGSIKAWFAIVFSPLLLGKSENITISLVGSTFFIATGTMIILII